MPRRTKSSSLKPGLRKEGHRRRGLWSLLTRVMGIERTSNQPGSMEPFAYADLYSKVAGYLKKQPVDIGDKVSKGDILAEIDAPELVQDLKHAEAMQRQAKAQVAQG